MEVRTLDRGIGHWPKWLGSPVNLIKILILANVLDPTVSLEAILDAFGVIDGLENGEHRGGTFDVRDPQDPVVRSMRVAIWS